MSCLTEGWFVERLESLPQSPEVKAYAIGVLQRFVVSTVDDMSNQSLVMAFIDAQASGDFVKFQRLGDWTLWHMSCAPNIETAVVESMGRMSYEACHRILKRQWRVYEELANDLPTLTRAINGRIFKDFTSSVITLRV